MNSWIERSCSEFADTLASKSPVPGGGGAAAYAGALGAALCSMVCHYTIGKKKYAAVEEDVKAVLAEVSGLYRRLEELVDRDAEAFEPLSRAYGIPADDPQRAEVLEQAALHACEAPLEMVRCCARAIELLEEMGLKGSVMVLSDVGCGALLCQGAMKAAAMNVFVNTAILRDREMAGRLESETDALLEQDLPVAERTAEQVMSRIRR